MGSGGRCFTISCIPCSSSGTTVVSYAAPRAVLRHRPLGIRHASRSTQHARSTHAARSPQRSTQRVYAPGTGGREAPALGACSARRAPPSARTWSRAPPRPSASRAWRRRAWRGGRSGARGELGRAARGPSARLTAGSAPGMGSWARGLAGCWRGMGSRAGGLLRRAERGLPGAPSRPEPPGPPQAGPASSCLDAESSSRAPPCARAHAGAQPRHVVGADERVAITNMP